LEKLQEGDKVLYLGGGTGRNLSAILDRVGDSGKVFYMESSVQMIEKAKKKISLGLEYRVNFLHQSDFTAIPLETFDVVVTQYFLDILPDRSIHRLFQEINKRPHNNRQWIFVDFFEVKGKKWLINLMIYFSKFFTGNPRKDLPDYGHYFAYYGWTIHEKKSFDKGFIQGWLMKRGSLGSK